MDLVDISTIDFAFAETYAELIKSDFQLEYVKDVILNKEFLAQLYRRKKLG